MTASHNLEIPEKYERYLSIDVLRGLTVALMVIVNNPGTWQSIYAPLEHAPWHGFTITDMVFPSFLFVVGNAMSFSMRKFDGQPTPSLLAKIVKRTVLIFLIGLFLNAFPFIRFNEAGEFVAKDLTTVRLFGVLQRIALCYGLAAIVVHYFSKIGAVIIGVVLLLTYWLLMFWFGNGTDPYSLEGNAARAFDLWLIGPVNLYKGEGIPFDPEGLLSTLPAIANVLGGYFVGQFIRQYGPTKDTLAKLASLGITLVGIGLLWNLWFPINKKIWTSSYAVFTIGLSTLVLVVLILMIEVKKYRRWTYFFEVFGRNPLVLFALSGIVVKTMALIRVDGSHLQPWIFNTLYIPLGDVRFASLMYAISFMMFIWLIGYVMDERKIYIKV